MTAHATPAVPVRLFTDDPNAQSDIAPDRAHPVVEAAPSTLIRLITLGTVVVPFLGVFAAMALLWGGAFDWIYLALTVGMFLVTGLGITVGYHRLFTHKSFDCGTGVKATLAVMGSMAAEGPVIHWSGVHRRHHQHSDCEEDPHSPHAHGGGAAGLLKGFWHAHIGWLFTRNMPADIEKYTKDLREDRVLRVINANFAWLVILGMAIPAAIGGLATMSWMGVLLGFLWGGLVRIFLVHHVTWSVNSVCHIWGQRPYESHDESRNNAIVGILGLGEGWHNNHHAFPASARHGLAWWQFDLSWVVIRTLTLLGLAKNARVPAPERLAAKARKA